MWVGLSLCDWGFLTCSVLYVLKAHLAIFAFVIPRLCTLGACLILPFCLAGGYCGRKLCYRMTYSHTVATVELANSYPFTVRQLCSCLTGQGTLRRVQRLSKETRPWEMATLTSLCAMLQPGTVGSSWELIWKGQRWWCRSFCLKRSTSEGTQAWILLDINSEGQRQGIERRRGHNATSTQTTQSQLFIRSLAIPPSP